jgi:hypothetical protein
MNFILLINLIYLFFA